MNKLESELESLGVQEVTPDEINELLNKGHLNTDNSSDGHVANMLYIPKSTKYTKWHTFTYTSTYKGKKYSVTELYAQGYNDGSKLVSGKDGCVLYKNKNYKFTLGNLLSIYAQKAIGQVKVLGWLPYELFFKSYDDVTTTGVSISYNTIQTYCYSYVKPAAKKDSAYMPCYTSNKLYIHANATLRAIKNGKSFLDNATTSTNVYSTAYASSYYALDNYIYGNRHPDSYVSSYSINNLGGKKEKIKINVPIYSAPGYITK